MAEKQEKVHFYMSMKSVMDLPADIGANIPMGSVYDKVRPLGDFYFINPNITLKEDDWIIFGVASTDNIDLQNETIDAKEVFGDHLDEFVSVGKIFYEHGYRYAKDASPVNRIDEPIGYPYMVEIHDNKLWIWAVLDKEHPLAQKVWESLSNSDERFRNKWGFSIGGILVGKPQATTTSLYGRVNRLPKMRLYEISVTPQPVNPYTWAQVVKSLVSEDSMDEELKAGLEQEIENETVDVQPDDKKNSAEELKDELEFGDDKAAGSPSAERKQGEDIVEIDVKKALDEEDIKLKDKKDEKKAVKDEEKVAEDEKEVAEDEEETAEDEKEVADDVAEEDDEKEQDSLAEALEAAANEEAEGDKELSEQADAEDEPVEKDSEDIGEEKSDNDAEMTPEADKNMAADTEDGAEKSESGEASDADDNVLVDLLGEGGDEEKAGENGGDASIELVLDEISALRETIDDLTSRVSKLLDYETQEHADEVLDEDNTEEPVEEGPRVSEEVLAKSLAAQEQILDELGFLREEIEAQKSLLAKITARVEAQPTNVAQSTKQKSVAEEALEARENFDPTAEVVTKSGPQQDVVVAPDTTSADAIIKSLSEPVDGVLEDSSTKSKFDAILKDPELLEITKSLVSTYTELSQDLKDRKIRESTYRKKSAEVLDIARQVLGLTRKEFTALVNEG